MLSEHLKTAKYLAIYETGAGGNFIAMVKNSPTLHLRIKTALQGNYLMDKVKTVEVLNDNLKITTSFILSGGEGNDTYNFDLLPGKVY